MIWALALELAGKTDRARRYPTRSPHFVSGPRISLTPGLLWEARPHLRERVEQNE